MDYPMIEGEPITFAQIQQAVKELQKASRILNREIIGFITRVDQDEPEYTHVKPLFGIVPLEA